MIRLSKKRTIFLFLLLISSLAAPKTRAQDIIDCSNAPIEDARCKEKDIVGEDDKNPCPSRYIPCPASYCDKDCPKANLEQDGKGCCCEVGKNTLEIPIGRLMDKSEWLAEQTIKEAERVVSAAEGEISAARDLYFASGQCKAENCDHLCNKLALCSNCECSGCSKTENPAEECSDQDPETMDCAPASPPDCFEETGSSSLPPEGFGKTYGALIAQAGDDPCMPEDGPQNLKAELGAQRVVLTWDRYPFDCPEDECSCRPVTKFNVQYRKEEEEGGSWREQGSRVYDSGWQREEEIIIFPPEPGETYLWRVVQSPSNTWVYSDVQTFSLSTPEAPGAPIDVDANLSDCTIRVSWEPGPLNCPSTFSGCLEEPLYKLRWKDTDEYGHFRDDWTISIDKWQEGSHADLVVDMPLKKWYKFQVKFFNGYEESEWYPDPPVGINVEPKPKVLTYEVDSKSSHSITAEVSRVESNCSADCPPEWCSMEECEEFEYKFIITAKDSSAIEAQGGVTRLTSGWQDDSEFTFECGEECLNSKTGEEVECTIFGNTLYQVWARVRNNCVLPTTGFGVYSGIYFLGEVETGCGEDPGCSNPGPCPSGKEQAPSSCDLWGGLTCVPEGTCGADPVSGCPEVCQAGEVCCPQAVACMKGGCTSGHSCEEDFCLGKCGKDATCCCNVNPNDVDTCLDLQAECTRSQPNCCCENSYFACWDEGKGCFGEPCPGDIGGLVAEIEQKLHQIQAHKKNIDELYARFKEEIPPQLERVRKRLKRCFEEEESETIFGREEMTPVHLFDCQTILKSYQEVHTYLPKKGEGLHRGEGLQSEPSLGVCWGNTYCRAEAEQARRGERESKLPWDTPCAEDLYCCRWK